MSNFVGCLKVWQQTEKAFACNMIMSNDIASIEFPQWKFKDYDIKIEFADWNIKTYEIKRDLKAEETSNFVIEFRCSWKPSWIYYSKADYIVYYVLWKFWMQERWELILRLIDTEKRIAKWWDWRRAEIYVIKADELPNLFTPAFEDDTNNWEMNNSQ